MLHRRAAMAFHEAGHAVIARVLCLTCRGASLIRNGADNEVAHSFVADPWQTTFDWDQQLLER